MRSADWYSILCSCYFKLTSSLEITQDSILDIPLFYFLFLIFSISVFSISFVIWVLMFLHDNFPPHLRWTFHVIVSDSVVRKAQIVFSAKPFPELVDKTVMSFIDGTNLFRMNWFCIAKYPLKHTHITAQKHTSDIVIYPPYPSLGGFSPDALKSGTCCKYFTRRLRGVESFLCKIEKLSVKTPQHNH